LYVEHTFSNDFYLFFFFNVFKDTLGSALRLYTPNRTVVSFNGGKDADVVLHLMRAASAKYCTDINILDRPPLVYFEDPKEFPEIEVHVDKTVDTFKFNIVRYQDGVKSGLAHLVEQNPRTLAFVLGTRQGDPNSGEQGAFAPSSSYMPPFMRVNPIITWTYGQIWQFINLHEIEVCALYQNGYTSLGKLDNTEQNPALRQSDGSYLAAYYLKDWNLERLGRISKRGKSNASPSSSATLHGRPVSTQQQTSSLEAVERIKNAKNVGLVIVGDEVLLGKVSEENSKYAVEEFRKRGLPVRRIAVVRDNEPEIAAEILRQSEVCDMVISSGGVGPTHDDVTLKAVASAFHTVVEENSHMLELLPAICKLNEDERLSPSQKRLAMLPRGGDLVWSLNAKEGDWPLFLYKNVFVLPGVPQFFKKKLDSIINSFVTSSLIVTARARVTAAEPLLVGCINEVVAKFPTVKIGSYPVNEMADTVVTFEWMDSSSEGCAADVLLAAQALESKVSLLQPPPAVTIDDIDSI